MGIGRYCMLLFLTCLLTWHTGMAQHKTINNKPKPKHPIPRAIVPVNDRGLPVMIRSEKNLADLIQTNPRLGYLGNLMKVTGLDTTLRGKGPFTLFAPVDTAFSRLPGKIQEVVLKHPEQEPVKGLILGHLVQGSAIMPADLPTISSVKTADGKLLAIRAARGKIRVEQATVAETGLLGSNGTIYLVDTFLRPDQIYEMSIPGNDDQVVTTRQKDEYSIHLKKSSLPPVPNFSPVPPEDMEESNINDK